MYLPIPSDLLNSIQYDESSPTFLRWITDVGRTVKSGDPAGCLSPHGYVKVGFGRKSYVGHRLVWCLCNYIIQPDVEIDHINGIRSDNRIANLRLATKQENTHNTVVRKDSRTQCKGLTITLDKRTGYVYYTAQVMCKGKVHRKAFANTEQGKLNALDWLNSMRYWLHGEFANNGQPWLRK